METAGIQFKNIFHRQLESLDAGMHLKDAALSRDMGGWTMALTNLIAECCLELNWRCCARWNPGDVLPQRQKEYFTLDVTAFESGRNGWQFPIATMELENMASKRKIAYCLWKLMAVASNFRCLFCYREREEQRDDLLDYLRAELVESLQVGERQRIQGETYICIGTRDDATYFPYGFFRWWSLNLNTTRFEVI